ncbi:MAG: Fic family protein [Candidatus Micrarchaeota archaeon]|nr:Fic family protein [Candidatus Micrarchaeota archaeon]
MDEVNSKYLYWNDILIRFHEPLTRKDLRLLWSYTNLARKYNTRPIKIGGLELRYVQTPQIEKALHDLDMKIGGNIVLEEEVASPDMRKKYLVNSLMEEAIASSQLEGAVTTRVVAKKMLRENRKPRNKSEQMIYNNYFTMKYIKEHTESKKPLALETIKEIHRIVTKDTFKSGNKWLEGTFRTNNDVRVESVEDGTLLHTPPDYHEVEPLLNEVCKFANSDSHEYYLHPLVKAIVIHYMVGYIHAFEDGNGRTARALFYWYVISQNYDYLEYIAISRAIKDAPVQYATAYLYSEYDRNDVTYFIKFNLRALRIALNLFRKYIDKTKAENQKIMETIRYDQELNFRQADIIIILSKSGKHMTIEEMQERYHITYETARTDLLDLVGLGYMHKMTMGRKFLFELDKEKCLSAMGQK